MQVCFIIDNSPLTKQTYSQSTSINNLHASLTILDTIKIGIETSLNDLSKNATYIWDIPVFHLFVTSKPNEPLSSFQHDKLHFNYQLKQIKSSDALTFPSETIKFALKHVSKFRMISEAETVVGYRKCSIYEPVLIFFFSFGITSRTLAKLQSRRLDKSMRSQYKFIHMRICFATQNQKQKNYLKIKAQVQNSSQALRWMAFAQKMNKGWHRNIFKYMGKQCLADTMTKCFTAYKPSLCSEFNFELDIKPMFPDYFKNSELNISSLMANQQENRFKVELYKIDESYGNYIPIPFQVTYSANPMTGTYDIDEVEPLQFYVDLSRKLNGNISNLVPFINFGFISNPPRFTKLEKQLERLGINKIYFPLYMKILPPGSQQKEKSYYLCGFLHFTIDSKMGNLFDLMITYPNFPYIEWIINLTSTQKSYSDNRQVEKLLVEYHCGVPEFYYRFLSEFFSFVAARIPALAIYETVASNNWNKNSQTTGVQLKNSIEEIQAKIRKSVSTDYSAMIRLKKQNEDAHVEGRAQCCPIYSKIEDYINYSKNISTIANANKNSSNSLSKLLEKVFVFNEKNGLTSYFSGQQDYKLGPMTRELNKYMQKAFANQGNGSGPGLGQFAFSEANQSINSIPPGLIPSKKLKQSVADQQNISTTPSIIKLNNENIDLDAQSVFPARQREIQLEQQFNSCQKTNQHQFEPILPSVNQNTDYMMPNSMAVDAMKRNPENMEKSQKIIEMERFLLLNKMNAEKDVQSLLANQNKSSRQDPRLTRRQLENLQRKGMMKVEASPVNTQNSPSVLIYTNKIKEQNSKSMKINISKVKADKFEQNLKKLESIGLISSASSFQSDST